VAAEAAGSPLLDIGAGVGLLVKVAREFGIEAVGVEPSSAGRAIALARYGIKLYADFAELTERHYGIITFWHVLGHVLDPLGVLQSAASFARPGTLLIVAFPNWQDVKYRVQRALFQRPELHVPTIIWRFGPEHLMAWTSRAGFTLDSIHYSHNPVNGRGLRYRLQQVVYRACQLFERGDEEVEAWFRFCTRTNLDPGLSENSG
jgi:SAM-dependent methyltransferase